MLSLGIPALGLLATGVAARLGAEGPGGLALGLGLSLGWLQIGGMILGFTGTLGVVTVSAWILLGVAVALGLGRPALPRLHPAWVLAALPGLAIFAMATVPEWYRDSLVYHAALPRAFAQAGGYVTPDDNVFASFPLGWESILAMVCALGPSPDRYPPFELRLVGAWAVVGAALATGALAERLGAGARGGALAGAGLLLVPTVMEFGSSSYVEPWLILLTTLSLLALIDGRAALGGALAGLAASVKYPGLAAVGFLGLALLAGGLGDDRATLRRAGAFLAAAIPLGAPFYLRNLLAKGNPVFPLAWDTFGGAGWDGWRAEAYAATLSDYGFGRTLLDDLLLPWRLFTTTDLRHGVEGSLGPALFLGLVALGARARRERAAGQALLVVILWSALWMGSVQQARFYLVAVPPLLAGLYALGRPAWLALLLQIGWAAAVAPTLWTRQSTGPWLRGEVDAPSLLGQLLPSAYGAMRGLEAEVPPTGKVWLVWTQAATYYLRRDYRLDVVFEGWRFEAALDAADTPEALIAALRAEGFTHVLVDTRFFLRGENADLEAGRTARLRARFGALIDGGGLVEKGRWGPVRLYAVGG